MPSIKGKRILFFAPKFFNYERAIAQKLCALGAIVDYFDERPSNSVLLKAALRLHAQSMSTAINIYYRNIISKIKNNSYDFVFVVNAEAITSEIVDELRMRFRNAKFVLYMWDSIRNKKNAMKLRHSFDCAYSFDRMDADKISEIKFRPLFFCDDYKANGPLPLKYDLVFVGTGHADRFAIIDTIKQQAAADGLIFFMRILIQMIYALCIKKR